jgi:hypothetical protein
MNGRQHFLYLEIRELRPFGTNPKVKEESGNFIRPQRKDLTA